MNMEEKVTIEKTGWWKSFLKSEFFYHYKHNIPAIIGSILVVVAILVAVFGRFIAPQNPYDLTAISLADSYLPPVWLDGGKAGFLLGSDEQGRDILSAIIYGSASSIMIGLVGMICSCAIGTTLGLLAGYFGGKQLECRSVCSACSYACTGKRPSGRRVGSCYCRYAHI